MDIQNFGFKEVLLHMENRTFKYQRFLCHLSFSKGFFLRSYPQVIFPQLEAPNLEDRPQQDSQSSQQSTVAEAAKTTGLIGGLLCQLQGRIVG